jgi:hypothetical protein
VKGWLRKQLATWVVSLRTELTSLTTFLAWHLTFTILIDSYADLNGETGQGNTMIDKLRTGVIVNHDAEYDGVPKVQLGTVSFFVSWW